MKITRKCAGCKEEFRKDELVEYFSVTGKTSAWYCHTCLAEKQARERFSINVCQIFGLKSPGPRIWTERKRLMDKYGYTDDAIVDCLDYIYNVLKKKKLAESLALIGPKYMMEMKNWKAQQKAAGGSIAAAITYTQMKEHIVPVKENTSKAEEIDLMDGLFDE